jgi:hypothetical protein
MREQIRWKRGPPATGDPRLLEAVGTGGGERAGAMEMEKNAEKHSKVSGSCRLCVWPAMDTLVEFSDEAALEAGKIKLHEDLASVVCLSRSV